MRPNYLLGVSRSYAPGKHRESTSCGKMRAFTILSVLTITPAAWGKGKEDSGERYRARRRSLRGSRRKYGQGLHVARALGGPMQTQAPERGSHSLHPSRGRLRGSMPVVWYDRTRKGQWRSRATGAVGADGT